MAENNAAGAFGTAIVAARILEARRRIPAARSALVAITGIDGCGKGFVATQLAQCLAAKVRVGVIGIDGWLNLPHLRFSAVEPAAHFYHRAIRFQELFSDLVLPLRDLRSVCVEADFAEETATSYRKHLYRFEDLDVVLLEGIYLLKREFQAYYDMSLWIDCTFETALERAISRAQEGLSPGETIQAYRTIYFPAQRIHFERDKPQAAATLVAGNDSRLGGESGARLAR